MKIGIKIRKIRCFRDLKQEYLAKQLKICPSAYRKIEKDQCDVKWSRICRIAALLSVTPEQLITFDAEKPIISLNELPDSPKTDTSGAATAVSDREREILESQIAFLKEQVAYLRGLHP